MGSHWVTCHKCGKVSPFSTDMMWFDEKGRIHDLQQWRCKNKECGILFKKAEPKAFEKEMKSRGGQKGNLLKLGINRWTIPKS